MILQVDILTSCDYYNLDFIKLIILVDDHRWLKTFEREFNDYCQSQYNHIKDLIEKLPSGLSFDDIISELRYKEEFKKLLFSYLNQTKFIADIMDKYGLSNISHTKAILALSIYPKSVEINFPLNDNEEEFEDSMNYFIPTFFVSN